jgi:hypothetical protein
MLDWSVLALRAQIPRPERGFGVGGTLDPQRGLVGAGDNGKW